MQFQFSFHVHLFAITEASRFVANINLLAALSTVGKLKNKSAKFVLLSLSAGPSGIASVLVMWSQNIFVDYGFQPFCFWPLNLSAFSIQNAVQHLYDSLIMKYWAKNWKFVEILLSSGGQVHAVSLELQLRVALQNIFPKVIY